MSLGSAHRTERRAPVCTKAGEELNRLRALVNTAQVFALMHERLLSPEERERLLPQFDSLNTVTAWQQVRGGSYWRAVLDIGLGIGLIAERDYRWLLREVGEQQTPESKPASTTLPHWDRATGKLFYGNRLCRKYRVQSMRTQLQIILDAFEAAGWRNPLPNPVGGATADVLYQALRRLNQDLEHISFHAQHGGDAIIWSKR